MGLPRVVEQPALRWRSDWPPAAGVGRRRFRIPVRENLRDGRRVFDTGNDPHRTAAWGATIILSGVTTNMMAGGEVSKAA